MVQIDSNGIQQPKLRQFIPVTKQKSFRQVQIQSICRQQNKCNLITEIPFGICRKYCGKRRNWSFRAISPAFSPFPTMFSKGFFFRVIKGRGRKSSFQTIENIVAKGDNAGLQCNPSFYNMVLFGRKLTPQCFFQISN